MKTALRLALATGVFAGIPCVLPAQVVPLVLHHLVITLDSATYHDIATSPFVREDIASVWIGVLSGVDGGIGMRMMGRYNFLEFMTSTRGAMAPAGIGIILASERAGGLALLEQQGHFEKGGRLTPASSAMNTRSLDPYREAADRIRPAGADSTSRGVEFEILQYTSAGAAALSTTDSMPVSNLNIARFLAPYFDSHKLFAYVTSATLAIPVDDIKMIVAVLSRDHVKVANEGEGAVIDLGGITLHLVPPWSGTGVKQLKFALTRDDPANPVYRFGPKSQLRFGPGPMAVWDFGPR